MNKKNFLAAIGCVSLLLAVATFNTRQSSDHIEFSGLVLDNIAALVRGEDTTDPNLARGQKKLIVRRMV